MDDGPAGDGCTAPPGCVLQKSVALEGDGTCIAQARHLAADFLTQAATRHGLAVSARVRELTQLVVSELVTNARKYAPGPVLLELRITGGLVEVAVWDSEPVLPAARPADAGRVGQHGLEIVTAIAHSVEAAREAVGKRITARIPLTDTPDEATARPLP
ncbi:ATP-binding protein [Streptomyces sp. NPDC002144]|uniref:ATP-binding protein n=1 Tax=Streptomyces sp. NPDC006668 TaxID=3156903 RepID=UPI0033EAB24E